MKKNKILWLSIIVLITFALTSCASMFGPPTVTFIVDDQVYSKYTLLEEENTAQIPDSPVKQDNEFLGWYMDKNGEQKFEPTRRISFSTKVYGIWKYHDVTFSDQFGNDYIVKQELNKTIELPQNPTKSGLDFCGWISIKTNTAIKESSRFTDIEDNEYYAIWSNVKVTRRPDGYWAVYAVKNTKDTNIVIPSYVDGKKVVEIAQDCFKDNEYMKSIYIPSTISVIGARAFYNCDSLESLTIPEGIKRLPKEMAYKCAKLSEVNLQDSLLYLGDRLPDTGDFDIDKYSTGVFTGCPIEQITLPPNLKVIGHGCLAETKIKSYKFPASLQVIEQYALRYNDELTGITIPASVTKLGKHVLDNCDNLNTIYYNTDADIPVAGFENDKSLVFVKFDGSPRKIEKYAFKNCDNLETIYLPKSVELLEKHSFGYCNELKNVYLLNDTPGFITRVDDNPFEECEVRVWVYDIVKDEYEKVSYWKNGMKKGWVKTMVSSAT